MGVLGAPYHIIFSLFLDEFIFQNIGYNPFYLGIEHLWLSRILSTTSVSIVFMLPRIITYFKNSQLRLHAK